MFSEINLSGIKGVLLDLDNTVYLYEPCHEYALNACVVKAFKELTIPKTKFLELYNKARKTINHQLHGQAACHSRLLYFQYLFEELEGKTKFK